MNPCCGSEKLLRRMQVKERKIAVLEGGEFSPEEQMLIDGTVDERDDVEPATDVSAQYADAAELRLFAFRVHPVPKWKINYFRFSCPGKTIEIFLCGSF